jgi:Fe-S-cluster containining protein
MPAPVCARCPKILGASCCEVLPGQHLATLTAADTDRIKSYLRRSEKDFADVEWLSDEEAQRYVDRWPLYDGYFRAGPARWTLKVKNGACVFHRKDSGCALPEETRPTACRLYPFEPRGDGTLSLQTSRGGEKAASADEGACLAVEEASEMSHVLRAFHSSPEKVAALCQILRSEVQDHARVLSNGERVHPSP